MSNDWQSMKFNPKQPPPKVTEGADPFNDQAVIASYFSSEPEPEEPPKKTKLARDYKRGDRVKIIKTGEIMEMTSVEVMNGSFFAVNIQNENDRRMLKLSAIEPI